MVDGSTAATTAFPGADTGGADVLNVTASSEGEWGNAYYVRIVKPDPAALTFTLEVGRHPDSEFEAEETFADLSMRADDPNYALTVVNEDSRLVQLSLVDASRCGTQGHGGVAKSTVPTQIISVMQSQQQWRRGHFGP